MTLKRLRQALTEQIKLVRENSEHIPQAETIANLAGKTLKTIQLEINAEVMREKGMALNVLNDVLTGKDEG